MDNDNPERSTAIEQLTEEMKAPDGTMQHILTVQHVHQLAGRFGVAGRQIEIEALQRGIIPLRYQRNHNALTSRDQIRLLQSCVVIVGLGGLGGTVTEILARVGVGHLVLVDGDVFEDHNLNRQLLCTHDGVGKSKAATAAQRVRCVNASVQVDAWDVDCDDTNRKKLFTQCDAVVDCLDNIPSRFVLQEGARQAAIPLVSAAVAGLAGHVTTIFPQDLGIELIYGACNAEHRSPKGIESYLGCLPQAVSTIASIESAEVIKVLLKHTDHLLRNKLLVIDLEHNTFETLRLA